MFGGCLGIIFVVVMVIAVLMELLDRWMISIALAPLSLAIYFYNRKHSLDDRKANREKEAYDNWEISTISSIGQRVAKTRREIEGDK